LQACRQQQEVHHKVVRAQAPLCTLVRVVVLLTEVQVALVVDLTETSRATVVAVQVQMGVLAVPGVQVKFVFIGIFRSFHGIALCALKKV
jgi:hypothetical protein